jgi:hypothetical protein
MFSPTLTDQVFDAYVECAIWSSTDDDGRPFDRNYSASDIAPESIDTMRAEVIDFLNGHEDIIWTALSGDMSEEQVGHDFWLTRNGHGAGFWDRGLDELGDQLTAAAKAYSTSDLYVGDDGRLHVS